MSANSSQRKISMTSRILHELRNHVHGIGCMSHFLSEGWSNISECDRQEYMKYIADSCTELQEISNRLLYFSVGDVENAKNLVLDFSEVDMNSVLSRVAESHNRLCRLRNSQINIVVEFKVDSAIILGDPFWIKHLVGNIVKNAILHSNSDNISIELSALLDSGSEWISCSVNDHGIGIPDNVLEKIFTPFPNNDVDECNLNGLGLAVCKEVVDMHNGKIMANNVDGKGAVVTFIVPRLCK